MSPDEVVTTFARHALRIAHKGRRWCRYAIPVDDLVQEALVGAWRANALYSPDCGVTLLTWVYIKMQFAVLGAIRRETHCRNYGRSVSIVSLESHDYNGNYFDSNEPLENPWHGISAYIDLSALRRFVRATDLRVLDLRLTGLSQLETAKAIGTSVSRVCQSELAAVAAMRAGVGLPPRAGRAQSMTVPRAAKFGRRRGIKAMRARQIN